LRGTKYPLEEEEEEEEKRKRRRRRKFIRVQRYYRASATQNQCKI
jgi:hypothetical protein